VIAMIILVVPFNVEFETAWLINSLRGAKRIVSSVTANCEEAASRTGDSDVIHDHRSPLYRINKYQDLTNYI
jgi:hypothetical protein